MIENLHEIPNPENVIEERTVDFIIKENGKLNEMMDVSAHVTYDTGDLTIITVANRIYPVKRQKDDKLFYSRRTYAGDAAWEEPFMNALLGFSIFLNVQQWWSPDNLFTLPNMVLLLIIFFLSYKRSTERAKAFKDVLYLKKSMQHYESLDFNDDKEVLSIYYPEYKGWSTSMLFLAGFFGLLAAIPFALASIMWEWEWAVSITSLIVVLFSFIAKPKEATKSASVYSPTVVAQMQKIDEVEKGEKIYSDLGILAKVNIKGKTKDQIKEDRKSIAEKYKDAVIIGFAPLDYYENIYETNEVNWQTIVAEAYEQEYVEEEKFKVLKEDDVRKVLLKTKTVLDDQETTAFATKTIKEILREYAENTSFLYNALVWTNQQLKTMTAISKSDKQTIAIQERVISSYDAINHREPNVKDPIDVDTVLKWSFIALIGFGILWGYFALTSQGVI